jgi:hypothetical protein
LLSSDNRAWYKTHLGSDTLESFQINEDMDQGSPVSSIVSSNSALGATKGEIYFGTGKEGVKVSWNPGECSALPMLMSKKVKNLYLNRLWFSLVESDETLKEDGNLLNFSYTLEAVDL